MGQNLLISKILRFVQGERTNGEHRRGGLSRLVERYQNRAERRIIFAHGTFDLVGMGSPKEHTRSLRSAMSKVTRNQLIA